MDKPMDTAIVRFLILSDTHADDWAPKTTSLPAIDVAIHCGDLTEESKIDEFRTSLRLLNSIDAPLKLVIAGNHDFTLDLPLFKHKLSEASLSIEPELLTKEFGEIGEIQRLFDDARKNGIIFLNEGTYRFDLQNGASLTWGFQFNPQDSHNFEIENGVDVVITHGPPKGVLDMTDSRQRGGCENLFAAITRSRPLTWRDSPPGDTPSHFSNIDNEQSLVVETLYTLYSKSFDTPESVLEKDVKRQQYIMDGFCRTSHCTGDDNSLKPGLQTLFVNAAIQGLEKDSMQWPWVVDIELPKRTESAAENGE
ncbi:ser/Thr protein phosphatase family protein [Thozetella sp. PMI_491]|nr:ser/Thr protein phosphatase family protein [Thozetella sp. PMI_491]